MRNLFTLSLFILILLVQISCAENTDPETEMPLISVKTTPVIQGAIEKFINLNGKTIYLKKDKISSPISAYVSRVNVQFGDKVQKGSVLFELQTKESRALNNNTGDVKVFAPSAGTVNELIINQPGVYLVEGDMLCTIVESRDVMIQVNVPYEYHSLTKPGIQCEILLPDNTTCRSRVVKILPAISETDQTQTVYLKMDNNQQLPENLNVTVQFVLEKHMNSFLIPRDALMTNEKLNDFWLMKMQNDSLAIKIPVHKGIENDSLVEVFSNELKINDLIINEGAFGLPDSSIVKITE